MLRRMRGVVWPGLRLFVVLVVLGCGQEAEKGDEEEGTFGVSGVSPGSGSARGGEQVTVKGTGFVEGAEVRFGGLPAASVEFAGSGELVVVTPRLMAGEVDVAVKLPDGREEVLERGFEVLPLELRFVPVAGYAFPGLTDVDCRGGAAADVDSDGDLDLVVGSAGGPLLVLRNDGSGGFESAWPMAQAPPFAHVVPKFQARDLAVADLDGDGCVDVVLSGGGGERCRLLAGDCAGGFADVTAERLPDEPGEFGRLTLVDVNGDDAVDILVGNLGGDGSGNRLYLAAAASGPKLLSVGAEMLPLHEERTSAFAAGDVEGDGDVDLVLANVEAADGVTLRLLLRIGEVFRDAPAGMLASPDGPVADAAFADVDQDGDLDLVAVVVGGQDRLYLNDGSGFFFDATAQAMPVDKSSGAAVRVADLNRDDLPDLLIANDGQQSRLYLNDGSGRFADHTPLLPIVQEPTRLLLPVNVDGDEDVDIVVLNGAGAGNRLLLSVPPEVLP